MVIAIDFDGTVVDHRYPVVGPDVPLAVIMLKELINLNHKIILFTMRSGYELGYAIDWFYNRKIPLYGVQYNPDQGKWSASNKCYADLYIDDSAFGCPLIHPDGFERPCVDWSKVKDLFV